MSEAKHTPGPWKLEVDEGRYYGATLVIYDADGHSLMGNADYYPWVPDHKPDWHLIAAAPDLLDALREAIADLHECAAELGAGPMSGLARTIDKANAAIAKATGA